MCVECVKKKNAAPQASNPENSGSVFRSKKEEE
jgi:hypothetical protein